MFKQMERPVRTCFFCENKSVFIDYKDDKMVRRFVNERGKIVDRRRTGCCAKHQRLVSQAVKRARHIAILPFVLENIR